MNEFTKIKDRILARIENYIADIELVGELTNDEKTIFASVKNIINKEFEQVSGEKEEPINTFRFKKMLVKEDMEKFQKFIDEHKRLRAVEKQKLYDEAMKCVEVQQRFYENTIHFADAICRLSQTCGISHTEAKAIIEESMEILKKIKTGGEND